MRKTLSILLIAVMVMSTVTISAFAAHGPKTYSAILSLPGNYKTASGTQSGTCNESDKIYYKTKVKITHTDNTIKEDIQNVSSITVTANSGKIIKRADGSFQARCQYNYNNQNMYGNISGGEVKLHLSNS